MLVTFAMRFRKRKRSAQTVPLSAAQRLPLELLIVIVRQLAPDSPYKMWDLCSVCSVCRSWSAAARYVLYSKIYLGSPTAVAPLCRTLARRHDLRALVQDVHFGYYISEALYHRWFSRLRKPVFSPLLLCTSIHVLDLWVAKTAPVTSIEDIAVFFPIHELPHLRGLRLAFDHSVGHHSFTKGLRRSSPSFTVRGVLPQLEELGLSYFPLDHLSAYRPCALPRLRQLSINTVLISPETLQFLLSCSGPHLVRLDLRCTQLQWVDRSIFDATMSRTIQALHLLGYGIPREALVLPSWPALHEVHMPCEFVQRVQALPRTVSRVSVRTQSHLRHRDRIWEMVGWICRALVVWRASAPGMAHLQIVDDWCASTELATWRFASFLLSGRCADLGIKLTVDVRARDMHSVL